MIYNSTLLALEPLLPIYEFYEFGEFFADHTANCVHEAASGCSGAVATIGRALEFDMEKL